MNSGILCYFFPYIPVGKRSIDVYICIPRPNEQLLQLDYVHDKS